MPANESVTKGLALIEKDTSKVLGLKVGKEEITPGAFVPKADATSAPQVSYNSSSSNATYIVIGIDPDAPFPSFAPLGPILHWIQPGLKANSSGVLESTGPFVANFIPPTPPPFSGPHRYVFFLYEQPEGFETSKYAPADGKEFAISSRMRWSLDDWEKEAKLGSAVAINYFMSN